ncbi:hypothetical protein C6P61_09725 [Malikia spinosa]|uniref:Terminase small subunit n=1 Tax=Malikia spinosa TaxID=86180 RepID=A0A2S9KE91_9BURK|nr:hypothetical protein [Malikia spinosa]OGB68584.1 MAG: hypothetical protein A2486_16115 [Burkholderiales bacterium RIFOXYC12_FULL_65_23]PRD68769.1 hypothetical protein C6P61_09725 [Malikia spinosa]
MTAPEQLSKRAFADRIGVKPSYVRQLEIDGRLVLTPDGKAVLVAESIARIEATRDPSKQAVAERHATERGAPALTGHDRAPVGDDESVVDEMPLPQYDFQISKAKREHWAAEREQAAFRKEAGELIERAEHIAAFARAGANLRAKLEAWSAVLPPQLVGRDEAAIRSTLVEQLEQVLRELATAITAQAQETAHAG